MRIPDELIEEIRSDNDIVDVISEYVPLKQRGSSYTGLCPFHNEKTPSFSVNALKQYYHCFGCGASGSVITFLMQYSHCSFIEAVETLAKRVNITLPEKELTLHEKELLKKKQLLYDIHTIAGRFFFDCLHSQTGVTAMEYIRQRQISVKIQKKFGIGFAPKGNLLYKKLKESGFEDDIIVDSGLCNKDSDKGFFIDKFRNRLMFPIIDVNGKIVGYGGRIIGTGIPKYLNSPETLIFNKSKNLFGLNFAKHAKDKEIIIVEGYMDVISLYQAGFYNTAATLGTAFNNEHAKNLKRYTNEVLLVFDSDVAGRAATDRTVPVLLSNGFKVRIPVIPEGKDPDEFIKSYGSVSFKKLLDEAKNHVGFNLDVMKEKFDMSNLNDKVKFTSEAAKIISTAQSSIELDAYAKEVSAYTNISSEAIMKEVEKFENYKEFQREKQLKQENVTHLNDKAVRNNIKEAQIGILRLITGNLSIYGKIKSFICPEDFLDPVFKKLAGLLFGMAEKNEDILQARLLNYFEDISEHNMISEVFNAPVLFENPKAMERALNDYIICLKEKKIDEEIEKNKENGDVNSLQRLQKEKLRLAGLYITIIDG